MRNRIVQTVFPLALAAGLLGACSCSAEAPQEKGCGGLPVVQDAPADPGPSTVVVVEATTTEADVRAGLEPIVDQVVSEAGTLTVIVSHGATTSSEPTCISAVPMVPDGIGIAEERAREELGGLVADVVVDALAAAPESDGPPLIDPVADLAVGADSVRLAIDDDAPSRVAVLGSAVPTAGCVALADPDAESAELDPTVLDAAVDGCSSVVDDLSGVSVIYAGVGRGGAQSTASAQLIVTFLEEFADARGAAQVTASSSPVPDVPAFGGR